MLFLAIAAMATRQVRYGSLAEHVDRFVLGADGNPFLKVTLTYLNVSNTGDRLIIGNKTYNITEGLVVTIPYNASHRVEATETSKRVFDAVVTVDEDAVRYPEVPFVKPCGSSAYGTDGETLTRSECLLAMAAFNTTNTHNITGHGCYVIPNAFHTRAHFHSNESHGGLKVTKCRERRGLETNQCIYQRDCPEGYGCEHGWWNGCVPEGECGDYCVDPWCSLDNRGLDAIRHPVFR